MKQSKKLSFYETMLNVVVGFAIQSIAQFYLFLFHNVVLSLKVNFAFGVIMTLLSMARQFAIRRLFEEIQLRIRLRQVAP